MVQIGNMTIEIERTGIQPKLFAQAGMHRLATDLSFDALEQLVRYLDSALLNWRRDRNKIVADHYRVLGISRTATSDEIRDAYRDAAKRCHPDVSGGDTDAAMAQINQAYAVLGDPYQRHVYDSTLQP